MLVLIIAERVVVAVVVLVVLVVIVLLLFLLLWMLWMFMLFARKLRTQLSIYKYIYSLRYEHFIALYNCINEMQLHVHFIKKPNT